MPENLFSAFQTTAQRHPKKVLVYQPGERENLQRTYAESLQEVELLSVFLSGLSLSKGTRVALLSETRYEWPIAYLAAASLGLVVVPLDPQLSPRDWSQFIRHAEAQFLFTSERFHPVLERLKTDCPSLRNAVVFGGSLPSSDWIQSYSGLLQDHRFKNQTPVRPPVCPDDLASIVFTSGTSGSPMAVELAHDHILKQCRDVLSRGYGKPGEVMASLSPLHHIFGFGTLVATYLCGGSIILFPTVDRELLLKSFQTFRPHYFIGVPIFYEKVGRAIESQFSLEAPKWVQRWVRALCEETSERKRLAFRRVKKILFRKIHGKFGGRMKVLICGGASLEPSWVRFYNAFGFKLFEGYGLTETTGVATCNDDRNFRTGSVGRIVSSVELKIEGADESGIGEICLRGPTVMRGYYKNPQATREVFDGEGWFHTGDLGHLDPDGFLFFEGRKRELIVTANGKNIYPLELERHFSCAAWVKDLCVFGVPIRSGGRSEKVHLQIVPDFEAAPELHREDLQSRIREEVLRLFEELPEYKRPASLGFSDEPFPRTTTLKIKKSEVKAKYLREKERSGKGMSEATVDPLLETEAGGIVLRKIRSLLPDERPITAESHFILDLGLDSLALLELWANLEEALQVSIPKEEIIRWRTLKDAIGYLQARPDLLGKLEERATLVDGTHEDSENPSL